MKEKEEKKPKERQRFSEPVLCGKCQGHGAVEDKFGFMKCCPKCEGEGVIWRE